MVLVIELPIQKVGRRDVELNRAKQGGADAEHPDHLAKKLQVADLPHGGCDDEGQEGHSNHRFERHDPSD